MFRAFIFSDPFLNLKFMRVYIVLILILSFVNARSQSAQIGVGMLDLNTTHYNITEKDTSISGKTRSTLNFKPVLTFNFFNKIDYSVQAGYFHERFLSETKSIAADKSVGSQISQTNRNSIYIKLGIGKRIDYKRIYVSYGLQVPLMVTIYDYSTFNSISKDSVGNLIQSTTNTNSLPNTYYAGLLLNFSSFYKLYKNLYIGGELQYGLYYTLQYGNRTYNSNESSSTGTFYKSNQVLKYNNSSFQLVVIPTIHIRYTIFNKKNSEEVKPLQ
jgi:hypothetical protein